MKPDFIKTLAAAVFASAAAYLKILALPVAVLFLAMIADHATGMVGAYITGTLSSKKGAVGIVKKLCYMFAVVCGIIIDYICTVTMENLGSGTENICFFGTLVTVWLILNEVVSILENLSAIGIPLPSFLKKAAERLKNNTDEKGGGK